MLQTKAVSPRLLELLNYAMSRAELSGFVLVGGTALALRLGHRISVDIDLFGSHELNDMDIPEIFSDFGETLIIKKSPKIQIFTVADIKMDIVNYRYPLIDALQVVDNIRMASFKDIAAMKLNAIAGRGSRKDFIDLYFLLHNFSLSEMLNFYQEKYADGSLFMVLKSLTYFDDAEREAMPQMLTSITWKDIKARLIAENTALR